MPQLATVVLNYKSADDTVRCLDSLARSGFVDQHVIVVDNGSGADDLRYLLHQADGSTLVDAGENLGYGGGNNLGIERALEGDVEFVLLLNPDTVVEPGAVNHLVRAMEAQADIGIVGPRLTNANAEPRTIWFDGGCVDLARGGATWHERAGEQLAANPPGQPRPTDYVTGAAMMVRREVFQTVGLVPERYFLYFEETDFNLRAQAAGWRTLVVPTAVVHHFKRSSGRLPKPHYVYYFVRNRLLFGLEWSPLSFDEIHLDLQGWIDAWEAKVEKAKPSWLGTYRLLVETAVTDAKEGRTGYRNLHELTSPAPV